MRVQSALAAVLAASAVAAGAAAQTERTPDLALVSQKPLVVSGTGFRSRERVTLTTITVSARGPRVVRARAGADGSFRTRLGAFAPQCGEPYVITGRGAAGSIAVLPLQAPPCAARPGVN
jgi:hypothetical protein